MRKKGSLTVEAALVLPVFVYGIMCFLYIFQILYIQEKIQFALTEVAKETSQSGYVYERMAKEENKAKPISEGRRESDFKARLKYYLPSEVLKKNYIRGGYNGIVMSASSFMESNKEIDIIAVYQIEMPILFFHIAPFTFVQRVKTRGFVGTKQFGEEENGEWNSNKKIVYVAETGGVYHLFKECSHLKLMIEQIAFGEVAQRRNANGGRYKRCYKCVKSGELSTEILIYITTDGDKYHEFKNCSGLKRNIRAVRLDTVLDLKACKRCQKQRNDRNE